MMDLTDAGLRERAYRWCGANQTTYSEWTADELTTAFIALRDAARAEQRERDAKIVENLPYLDLEHKPGLEILRKIAAAL
mgnify:CR=1 FL=1